MSPTTVAIGYRAMVLPLIFVGATIFLYYLFFSMPPMLFGVETTNGTHDLYKLLIAEIDSLKRIVDVLIRFQTEHYYFVTFLFVYIYLYQQTFAIPGLFISNVVGGALFDIWLGFVICCILSTVGSTMCYILFDHFGKYHIRPYFGKRIAAFQKQIDESPESTFCFLLFARLVPMSPSWFLGIAAPIVNIPLNIFIVTTFIGLAPYNFVCAHAGATLSDLSSWDDVFSRRIIVAFAAISLVPLAFGAIVRYIHNRFGHIGYLVLKERLLSSAARQRQDKFESGSEQLTIA